MSFIKSFWPLAHARQALVAIGLVAFSVGASAQSIVVASTTSTEQSGLFGYLLPEFKKASGIDVKVVALGTGQALDTARRGDADAVFVHDMRVPGMLHGRVVRPPYAGADHGDFIGNTLESVDEASIAHIPGIRAVVVIRDPASVQSGWISSSARNCMNSSVGSWFLEVTGRPKAPPS